MYIVYIINHYQCIAENRNEYRNNKSKYCQSGLLWLTEIVREIKVKIQHFVNITDNSAIALTFSLCDLSLSLSLVVSTRQLCIIIYPAAYICFFGNLLLIANHTRIVRVELQPNQIRYLQSESVNKISAFYAFSSIRRQRRKNMHLGICIFHIRFRYSVQ